ncbi:hypothetical protein OUZ56_019895 [Daphnia magna]|uniref:Uncharacterized protein n=1 Tax=Daphnia magna TaxID=35525 RepID=A0ABQ9ZCY1_9CRUS|nr:hypothetical protein OUZ56_019895 [Daphnia magna]
MSGTQFFLPRSGPNAEKQNKLGCQTTLQRPYSSVVEHLLPLRNAYHYDSGVVGGVDQRTKT